MEQPPANRSVAFWSLVGYLLAHILVDGRLWVEGIVLAPSSGLAIPLGVVFGLPAAVGLAVGVVVKDSLRLVLSVDTMIYSLWLFVMAAAAHLAWQYRFHPASSDLTQPSWWSGFAACGLTAITTGAAIFAWASELLGVRPFYLAFGTAFLTSLVGACLFTPLVVVPVARSRLAERLGAVQDSSPSLSGRRRTLLTVGPFLWAVCGLVWSIGFQIRQRTPVVGFERLNLEALYYVIHPDVFGQGGRRLQVLGGAVMLTLLIVGLGQPTHTQHG